MGDSDSLVDPNTDVTSTYESDSPTDLVTDPFMAGPDSTFDGDAWFQGVPLYEDIEEYADAFRQAQHGDWAQAVFEVVSGSVGLGLDGLGLAADPVGTGAAWAVGWLLEHVKLYRIVLDGLAGNPTTVQAYANNWQSIGNRLLEVLPDFETAVTAAPWHGPAADAFRDYCKKTAVATDLLAQSALALSTLITTAGNLVKAVRTAVRDLIGILAGEVADLIADAATLGAYTANAEAGIASRVAATTPKIMKLVRVLAKAMDKGANLIDAIRRILQTIAQALSDTRVVPKYSPS